MRLLPLLLALATTACAGSRPRLSFAVEQRILRETTLDDMPDGEAASGDAIVRLVRAGSGACSGALVGPHHVLTAQHCVVRVDAHKELTEVELPPGDLHVELGGDALPWGRVGVREVHGCGGLDLEHDVAVLVLSKAPPRDVPRIAIAWDVPAEAGVIEMGGYGSPHPLKKVPLTSWDVLSLTRHTHQGPVLAADASHVVVGVPGLHGDSGGPIVDTKTGHVVSVVSRLFEERDRALSLGPSIAGPRLATCRSTIETALRR